MGAGPRPVDSFFDICIRFRICIFNTYVCISPIFSCHVRRVPLPRRPRRGPEPAGGPDTHTSWRRAAGPTHTQAGGRLAGRTHTQACGRQRAGHTHKHTHKHKHTRNRLATGSGPDGEALLGALYRRMQGLARDTHGEPPSPQLSLSLSLSHTHTHTPEGACADARSHGSRWFAYPSRRRNVRVAGGIYPSRRRNIRGFTCGRGRAGTTTAWRPQSCSILVEDGTDLTCLRPI